jgi:hypothetical protein
MRTIILIALLCPLSKAQSVGIRVIDMKGQAIANQPVRVSFFAEKLAKAADAVTLETDARGEASFNLPEPAPPHLEVRVNLKDNRWFCNCVLMTDTSTVLQRGVVEWAPHESPAPKLWPDAQPGHIVFVARPIGFFERLLYPLIKE